MEKTNSISQARPLKRHPALIPFSKDHHFALLLVWKIRQGIKKNIAGERIAKYLLFFFEEALKEHFAEEERDLFSALPQGDEKRMQAMEEHQKIIGLTAAIRNNFSDTTLQSTFAGLLEDHIRFEERTLFPYIEEKLTPAALEAIASKAKAVACDTDDRWQDPFWK